MSRAGWMPLAAAYGAAVSARAAMYRRGWLRTWRAPVPVISIGNLVAGGTGKTPVTALVAGLLQEAGMAPAVISRGYGGRRDRDPMVVSDGSSTHLRASAAEAGDEPVMLARSLPLVPVIVARRREAGARLAVSRLGARCLVLDDGFQHLALARDLDLVVLDAERPFDNGRLLPSGFLREPPDALARAGAVLLSGPSAGAGAPADANGGSTAFSIQSKLRPGTPVFHAQFRAMDLAGAGGDRREAIAWLQGRRVVAFAGIARPERFERALGEAGAVVEAWLPFSDHHVYSSADADRILSNLKTARAEALITTEKDLSRLAGTAAGAALAGSGLLALRGETVVASSEQAAFRETILDAARGASGGAAR